MHNTEKLGKHQKSEDSQDIGSSALENVLRKKDNKKYYYLVKLKQGKLEYKSDELNTISFIVVSDSQITDDDILYAIIYQEIQERSHEFLDIKHNTIENTITIMEEDAKIPVSIYYCKETRNINTDQYLTLSNWVDQIDYCC